MAKTPYMNLDLPTPGATPAGQWGGQLNEALRDHVDSHDHVPGRGKPVPSDGIKIDKDLTFRGHSATNAKSVGLVSQQTKIGTPGHVHVVDGDLYFTDGHGRHVRLTENGQVVPGLEGNIQGLVHPAEARYSGVEQKFTFTHNVNTGIRAMLDVGGLMLRAMAAGAKRILLKAPEIVDEYDLTLPVELPEEKLPLHLDPSGQMSTGQVETAQIADEAVTTAKLDDKAVTTAKIDDGAVTTAKITGIGAPSGIAPLDEHGTVVGTAEPDSAAPGGKFTGDGWAAGVEGRGQITGVYGESASVLLGGGVHGKGFRGVYGEGATGVAGEGTHTGVYADGVETGVWGISDTGHGVVAESANGVAFRIVPRSGSLGSITGQAGDFLVLGSTLHFHNGSVWKKVMLEDLE